MNKKKLLSLALVVIMIATLSFGTLAWFSDVDQVKNEFMVATTTGGDPTNPDDIFSVDIWEPVDENEDGVITDDEKDQDGLKFENILPGSVYDKEPTVENTGAYDQYIRVVVTVSDGKAWLQTLGAGYDLTSIFLGHDESKWTRGEQAGIVGEDLVYVYYYNEVLKPGETVALFEQVKLPGSLTQADMAALGGSFDLTIRADAIQTENLADNAKAAFAVANWGNYVNTEPQG